MPALPNQFAQVTTEFTTTSTTYVDVTGAILPNAGFVAGRKYLIYVTAQIRLDILSRNASSRMVHGTTPFDSSEMIFKPSTNIANRHQYSWWTVYTAVGGEDVKMQTHTSGGGSETGLDQVTLISIEISEELTENTDWFFNEDLVDLGLTVAFQDGASITFTPGTAGDDWLVLTRSKIQPQSTIVQQLSRISRTGEATTQDNTHGWEAESSAVEMFLLGAQRVYNLGAASNTFAEQSGISSGANNGTRVDSGVFAINLSKLQIPTLFAQTDGNILTDTTNAFATSTEVQTLNFVAKSFNYWMFSSFIVNDNTLGIDALKARQQVDQVDQPPNQTSDNYDQMVGDDVQDQRAFSIFSREPGDPPPTTTIDLDVTSTVAKQLRNRLIFAFPLFVQVTNTNTFSVNAILVVQNTNTFSVDAFLQATQTNTFTVDAFLRATQTLDFIVDANVQQATSDSFEIDALLQATQTNVFTVDVFIRLQQTNTFSVDAFVQATQTNDFTVDAFAQATQTNDFTVDALLQLTQTETFTVDAFVQATQTETFTVDAFLRATQTFDFTVDGLTQTPASVMWGNDALLQATQTETFTVDAKVIVRNTNDFTVNGILVNRNTNDFTVNAIVVNRNTNTFSVDAKLILRNTNDFTVDAIPERFFVFFNFTVDANIVGQIVTPDEDISNAGGWVPQIFPTLFQELDNIPKTPGQFIRFSSSAPTIADSFEVGMSPMADPNRSDGHVIQIVVRANTPGPVADDILKIRIKLFQDGTTLIATTPFFTIPSATEFTVLQFILSGAEADAITNYGSLSFRGEPVIAQRNLNTFSGDAILV